MCKGINFELAHAAKHFQGSAAGIDLVVMSEFGEPCSP
jgi:hypothetical protein